MGWSNLCLEIDVRNQVGVRNAVLAVIDERLSIEASRESS